MRALLLVAVFIEAVLCLSCPSQYQLNQGKCIRPLYLEQNFIIGTQIDGARSECAKDGAHLPIIKSDEENDAFKNIANSFPEISGRIIWIVLDLICNTKTLRLEWIEGSSVTYTGPNNCDFDFDCVSSDYAVIDRPNERAWSSLFSFDGQSKTVFCVIDEYDVTTVKPTTIIPTPTSTTHVTGTPVIGQCGEYELMTSPADASKPCIKIFTDPLPWNLAQQKCAADFGSLITINNAEENKYFWRTAISNSMINGMHIGAHQSTADPSVWVWSDGEIPFTGKTYDNFVGFFPIPGAGECVAMQTETPDAMWTNENCDNNQQPFICRRSDFSTLPKTCPKDAQNAGEDIFSPGLPNSDIRCEYMLFVSANKLVELEVMTLVANENQDFLEISEGSSGPHLLANLTGTILTPTKFTTEQSNVLRVNWKPSGTGSERGFRMRFNEIDP